VINEGDLLVPSFDQYTALDAGASEGRLPNPNATILWLSDSPELNEQSKQKFAQCSDIFTSGRLETIDVSYDKSVFEPGRIHFINTQKFASSSILTRPPGDGRQYTIWQTIRNTIEAKGADFLLIIDEAHKGMLAGGSQRDFADARTIVQRFLLGSEQIPKMPLVLGISATPKRFNELLDASNRTGHKVLIDPAVVRVSGLLKHRLLIHNPAGRQRHADDSLLREAVKQHVDMKDAWREYCLKKDERMVRPLLVIQVEDGQTTEGLFSRTDIDQVVRSVRECIPGISPEHLCHCFQDDGQLKADGISIRKVDPSKLQDDLFAEVVLFKTALTTGWDCPRAETMMSYRTAKDATMIEQLIGRMIRAPLARSIESNETLNTVRLFLPGFDRVAVQGIIRKLSNPDSEDAVAVEIEEANFYASYDRSDFAAMVFETHPNLPTTRVPRTSQQSALIRVLKLATRLSVSTKIEEEAKSKCVNEIVKILIEEADTRRGTPGFESTVGNAKVIRVEGHLFDVFANRYQRLAQSDTVEASDENVDQIFRAASRRITGEEALGVAFWRARPNIDDPNRPKLEFYALVQDQDVRTRLENWASAKFDSLYKQHQAAILALPAARLNEIEKLAGGQNRPIPSVFYFKDVIESKRGEIAEDRHIYSDSSGHFHPTKDLNSWERHILQTEEEKPGFIGWFRNPEIGDDRVAVPYQDTDGTWHTKAPDFVVFHERKGSVLCSLIEPHDINDSGSWTIARGLATFAEENMGKFDRIEFTIEENELIKRIDLTAPGMRKKVMAVNSNEALRAIFDQIA
jgi:type III restriction enzyme